jgi:hypothetical protein
MYFQTCKDFQAWSGRENARNESELILEALLSVELQPDSMIPTIIEKSYFLFPPWNSFSKLNTCKQLELRSPQV